MMIDQDDFTSRLGSSVWTFYVFDIISVLSSTSFLASLASSTFDSSGIMFSELSFGNGQHLALGILELASFAFVFSWSTIFLRPSLPISRAILEFSGCSLLFQYLLFAFLCYHCFLMVSFFIRVLYFPTTEGLHRCGILGVAFAGNTWDRTGTSQEARSIDFSNFLVGVRRYPLLLFGLRVAFSSCYSSEIYSQLSTLFFCFWNRKEKLKKSYFCRELFDDVGCLWSI